MTHFNIANIALQLHFTCQIMWDIEILYHVKIEIVLLLSLDRGDGSCLKLGGHTECTNNIPTN